MDCLYGDLENYEQEKVIDELKNENKELKRKLEEYASTLDKLQKDFDKLSAEYKKLEVNYSSLLKTARAEIERKTKIITNLNVEKDQLVINILQNRGRIPTNHQSKSQKIENTQQTEKQTSKGVSFDKGKNETSVLSQIDKTVPVPIHKDRKDIDKSTCSLGMNLKVDSDSKEKELKPKTSNFNNVKDKEKNKTKIQQSHPNESVGEKSRGDIKFSSDEEQDDNPRDRFKRDRCRRRTPPKYFNDRKRDNYRNSRNGPKDNIRVDDKYANYHEMSRDFYRKNNSCYYENDRYRIKETRDKYDSSQRFRRRYSPSRSRYNTHKEFLTDRPHRTNNVSHRILESPAPEKYNQHGKSRDIDRPRFQNEEVMKHKICDNSEEPVCKRMRTESLNRQSDEHNNINLQPDRNIGANVTGAQPVQFSYLSLQSPDYVHLENNPSVHQIKEIMTTAATDLEDPRLKSKKYILKTNKDKVALSTVVGRDVDIKMVDTRTWGKDKDHQQKLPKEIQKMPTPLREKSQISEDLVKEIYLDINHPILNLSFESGEIECSEDDMWIAKVNKNIGEMNTDAVNTDTVILKAHEKCDKPVHNSIQSQYQIQDNKKPAADSNDNMLKSSSFFKQYSIPKTNESNSHKPLDNVITNSTHNFGKKDWCQENKTEKEKEKNIQKELDIQNPLKLFCSAGRICENKTKDLVNLRQGTDSPEKVMSSVKDTVEGDLELSDETSDYTELTDQIRYNKERNASSGECINKPANDSTRKEAHTIEKQNTGSTSNPRGNMKHGIETMYNSKHTDIPDKLAEVQPQKTQKTYKEDKSKDMKTKLCDLFGDSSSLITPDDLGIVEPPITNQIINDYVPLFDNTQDAIDLNVEEMEKVQKRSLKTELGQGVINNEHQDAKLDRKPKNKGNKTNNEGKNKLKSNTAKPSATEHIFMNNNAKELTEESNIVKTVIISTGIQNNCDTENLVSDTVEENRSLDMLGKVTNNVTNFQTLPSLKALATSTPHKISQIEPTLSVPESTCNPNNSLATGDVGNVSVEDAAKNTQSNLDVPDVRIIIKKRRRGKVTPS